MCFFLSLGMERFCFFLFDTIFLMVYIPTYVFYKYKLDIFEWEKSKLQKWLFVIGIILTLFVINCMFAILFNRVFFK